MSVEEVTMYRLICDRCGQGDDGEFYAWVEAEQAIDVARESEWLITDDGGHFCAGCWIWDEEADAMVPAPPLEAAAPRSTGSGEAK